MSTGIQWISGYGPLWTEVGGDLAWECCCDSSTSSEETFDISSSSSSDFLSSSSSLQSSSTSSGGAVNCGNCDPQLDYEYTVSFSNLGFDFEKFNGSHILQGLTTGCGIYTVDGYGCCRWVKLYEYTDVDCGEETSTWQIALTGSKASPTDYRYIITLNYGPLAACTLQFRRTGLTREEFCLGPSGSFVYHSCTDLGCPHRRASAVPPPSVECRCNDLSEPKCNCLQNTGATCVVS